MRKPTHRDRPYCVLRIVSQRTRDRINPIDDTNTIDMPQRARGRDSEQHVEHISSGF